MLSIITEQIDNINFVDCFLGEKIVLALNSCVLTDYREANRHIDIAKSHNKCF